MINLHDIRYARLGTQDLDGAIRFATSVVGLQLVAREGNTAYFRSDKADVRGDTRDHTLVYFEGDPADQTIGLELIDPDDLDAVGSALEQAGRPVHFGTRTECDSRRTRAYIASSDPSGNKLEILARPYNSGGKYFPGRQVGITNFSHVALFSTDTKRDTEFWTRLVNARVSDWLGEATFLRIGTVHHSVVLMPSSRPGWIWQRWSNESGRTRNRKQPQLPVSNRGLDRVYTGAQSCTRLGAESVPKRWTRRGARATLPQGTR